LGCGNLDNHSGPGDLGGQMMIHRLLTNIYFILAGAVILAALAVWFAPQGTEGADLGRWI